ncbi:hypothetical protein HGO41_13685 [Rahnella sp. CG8]|nr:hypothetical protein [Rahnella sp. CG8]MCM2446214.1 hypothetical protein [Rahnella sp. CG8]
MRIPMLLHEAASEWVDQLAPCRLSQGLQPLLPSTRDDFGGRGGSSGRLL